jgi:hypothetical protein
VRPKVESVAEAVTFTIDRRRFLRRAANSTFYILSVSAAGGVLSLLGEQSALAAVNVECAGLGNTGLGCPNQAASGYPCGPSRCCNQVRSGTPAGCDCSVGSNSVTCKTHTGNQYCFGSDHRAWLDGSLSPGCWTCTSQCFNICGPQGPCKTITTCCDCKTDAAACNDPNLGSGRGRCIAYHSATVFC